MRKEYRVSWRVDAGLYGVCLIFVLFGFLLFPMQQWVGAVLLILVGIGGGVLVAQWRRMSKPYLIVDETGVSSPQKKFDLAWTGVSRVYVWRPKRGESGPRLAFELKATDARDRKKKVKMAQRLTGAGSAPQPSIPLPPLNASLSRILQHMESVAPGVTGRGRKGQDPEDEAIATGTGVAATGAFGGGVLDLDEDERG